jgi:hypothetical protein
VKVGDLLYTIYNDGWAGKEKLTVHSARITAVGPRTVKIDTGTKSGLAFGCRRQLSLDNLDAYGRTPKEAWLKYYTQISESIARHERELVSLRTLQQHAIDELRERGES